MKFDLKLDTEMFKKSTDGPEDWDQSGCRCTVCKEEVDAYHQREGHNIVDCLQGLVLRIEKLENTK